MDWLTAVNSFNLLVEKGSFTKAAHVAEISPSAMSKRIDWLEKKLGIALFVRTTRQVNLTDAGEEFLPRARCLLKQFEVMLNETQQTDNDPRGLLKVAATLAVGNSLLMPIIETFLLRYPKVKIQLDILPFGGLPDLEHDLVLCRKQENFNSTAHKGTLLISYHMSLFAAPTYLANQKEITTKSDLITHKMIITNFYRKAGMIELENGEELSLSNFNFVSDHLEAMISAAIRGMGLFIASPISIKQEIEQKVLVPVLPDVKTREMQLWAFYPKTEFMPVKSRMFLDFIKESL